jgi:hypothetical protein
MKLSFPSWRDFSVTGDHSDGCPDHERFAEPRPLSSKRLSARMGEHRSKTSAHEERVSSRATCPGWTGLSVARLSCSYFW